MGWTGPCPFWAWRVFDNESATPACCAWVGDREAHKRTAAAPTAEMKIDRERVRRMIGAFAPQLRSNLAPCQCGSRAERARAAPEAAHAFQVLRFGLGKTRFIEWQRRAHRG